MFFFALSVFTLGLVTAENNGSTISTWPMEPSNVTQGTYATAVNATAVNATADNATAVNTTDDKTTNDKTTYPMSTQPFPADAQTPGSRAIPVPSAQPAIPNTPSVPTLKKTTTTRANPKKDVAIPIPGTSGSRVDTTGIVIISLGVVVCLLIAGGCFIRRNYQSRNSVDLRTEGASVPLSVVVDHTEPDNSTVYTGMQTADNGQVDSKKSQDSENNEVPKPKDPGPAEDPMPKESGPAEDPKPKESGPAEDTQPKDSGVAEVPQPMTEQKDQAEQACLIEAGATTQPASPGPAEAGALEGATDDEGIVSNHTSAESLKEPTEGTEASATDALIEN